MGLYYRAGGAVLQKKGVLGFVVKILDNYTDK